MTKGTIVLVNYPFFDANANEWTTKSRPALVLQAIRTDLPQVVVCMISSTIRIGETRVLIPFGSLTAQRMGLRQESVIHVENQATVKISAIKQEIGYANADVMEKVDLALKKLYGL